MLLFRIINKLQRLGRDWLVRCAAVQQLEAMAHLAEGIIVNGPIHLENPGTAYFAEDVCINPGLTVRGDGEFHVGAHTHFGRDVLVLTANHNYRAPELLPYDKVRIRKDVRIGDCVWICDRVIIVPGITIGEGSIIAAGSVVTRNVPPGAVVGGSPAVVVGERDMNIYRSLRERQAYLDWPRNYDLINGRKLRLHRRSSAKPS